MFPGANTNVGINAWRSTKTFENECECVSTVRKAISRNYGLYNVAFLWKECSVQMRQVHYNRIEEKLPQINTLREKFAPRPGFEPCSPTSRAGALPLELPGHIS